MNLQELINAAHDSPREDQLIYAVLAVAKAIELQTEAINAQTVAFKNRNWK